MNRSDTWFVAVAAVVSIASGFWFGSRHGQIGAVFGIIGGVATVFIAFTGLRMLGPRKQKERESEQSNAGYFG